MSLNRRFATIVADTAMWLSTGTTSNTFTVDSDSALGKIVIDVALGAADKSLTLTNTALTDNRTATFQDADGTVAYLTDVLAAATTVSNTFTIDSDSALGKIILDVTTGAADKAMTITNAALTDDRTVTLQNASGTVCLTTGTPNASFVVDNDATTGKISVVAAAGAADKTLTLTNAALTADRTVTFPDATGTVALTSNVAASTGTTATTFTVDSDAVLGRIAVTVAAGAADKVLTLTNAALTDDRTVTFQDAAGTVALTADVAASTGTSANTFTVDSDSVLGKMVLDVTTGAADKSITVTNEALTADQVITLPNATGTVQLLNHVVLTHAMGTNTALATTGADLADGAGGTQYGVFVAPVDIVVTTMYDTLTEAYSKDATDAVIAVKDDTGAVITTRTLTAGGEAAKAHHSTAPGGGPATVTAGTRLDLAITSTGAGGTGHAVVVLEYYVP